MTKNKQSKEQIAMSNTLFLIFNHGLTYLQRRDAHASLGVDSIVDLPENLKPLWNQVPADLDDIRGYLAPVRRWLSAQAEKGDFVLIQGDFGASFQMAVLALERGLVPVYSTTTREAEEKHLPDGSATLTHSFRHVRFRRY